VVVTAAHLWQAARETRASVSLEERITYADLYRGYGGVMHLPTQPTPKPTPAAATGAIARSGTGGGGGVVRAEGGEMSADFSEPSQMETTLTKASTAAGVPGSTESGGKGQTQQGQQQRQCFMPSPTPQAKRAAGSEGGETAFGDSGGKDVDFESHTPHLDNSAGGGSSSSPAVEQGRPADFRTAPTGHSFRMGARGSASVSSLGGGDASALPLPSAGAEGLGGNAANDGGVRGDGLRGSDEQVPGLPPPPAPPPSRARVERLRTALK